METAKRECQEETGVIQFDIKPICVYSVTGKNSVNETGEETFESHIAFPDSKYGYKKENIYYFDENGLMEL